MSQPRSTIDTASRMLIRTHTFKRFPNQLYPRQLRVTCILICRGAVTHRACSWRYWTVLFHSLSAGRRLRADRVHLQLGQLQEESSHPGVLSGEESPREQSQAGVREQVVQGGQGSGRPLPLHPGRDRSTRGRDHSPESWLGRGFGQQVRGSVLLEGVQLGVGWHPAGLGVWISFRVEVQAPGEEGEGRMDDIWVGSFEHLLEHNFLHDRHSQY